MPGRMELSFTGEGEGSRRTGIWGSLGRKVSSERPMGPPSVEVEWAAGQKLLSFWSSGSPDRPGGGLCHQQLKHPWAPQPQSLSCSPRTAK